jgi:hypothetical protein
MRTWVETSIGNLIWQIVESDCGRERHDEARIDSEDWNGRRQACVESQLAAEGPYAQAASLPKEKPTDASLGLH